MLSIDSGNFMVKAIADNGDRFSFRHAIVQLSEAQYAAAFSDSRRPPTNIIKVNGTPYALGDAALRLASIRGKQGRERYVKGYADVLLAYALYNLYDRDMGKLKVLASHAPRDIDYASHLATALKGTYVIEGAHGTRRHTVTRVNTFDEPVGSLFHWSITSKGTERRNNPLANVSAAVIDIGGFTTDIVMADSGQIDTSAMTSIVRGTHELYQALESHLTSAYRSVFQHSASQLDPRRLEKAMRTGYYEAGRHQLDVRSFVSEQFQLFANDILQAMNSVGGGILNYDAILLTGGGSALMYDYLKTTLDQTNVLIAEDDFELLPFANAIGGIKLNKVMLTEGYWT